MISIYTAQEAKAAADNYYQPLVQIFDYIRKNAANGLYAVSVSGQELTATQLELIQKCGYKIEITQAEGIGTKYQISWSE